jgi:NADH:ubiquinone oxidoreductase subunit 4 (subunit M)
MLPEYWALAMSRWAWTASQVLFVLLAPGAGRRSASWRAWESVRERVREYMVAFLVLESMMVGMFCALDFVLFYIFFEAVLIPMFLIIGVWGGARRVYAAFKFFLYTLAARCSCCWRSGDVVPGRHDRHPCS